MLLNKIKQLGKKVVDYVQEHEFEIFVGAMFIGGVVLSVLASAEEEQIREDNALHMVTVTDKENHFIGNFYMTGKQIREYNENLEKESAE